MSNILMLISLMLHLVNLEFCSDFIPYSGLGRLSWRGLWTRWTKWTQCSFVLDQMMYRSEV